MSAAHPPPPWRLGGPAVVVPLLVPVTRARAYVPADVAIVPAMPGLTLGCLVAVTYEPGSTLSYSELLVAAATVRSGTRVGGWISHIWVDDEQSVSGGRSIWKLPKHLAEFTLDRRADVTQRLAARAEGTELIRIAAARPRLTTPRPIGAPVPMISAEAGSHFFTLGRAALLSGGPARVHTAIPAESPLTALEMKPLAVGVAGQFRLYMDAPSSM